MNKTIDEVWYKIRGNYLINSETDSTFEAHEVKKTKLNGKYS
jgi:hypothetical protein